MIMLREDIMTPLTGTIIRREVTPAECIASRYSGYSYRSLFTNLSAPIPQNPSAALLQCEVVICQPQQSTKTAGCCFTSGAQIKSSPSNIIRRIFAKIRYSAQASKRGI